MPPCSKRQNTSASEMNLIRMTDEELSEPPTETERPDSQEEEEETVQSEMEGDDASQRDEEEPVEEDEAVMNPSRDIKGDLKRILEKDKFKLKGSFYHSKSFTKAPNPSLKLDGIGVVGLPLSEDVAKCVISKCEQAPFGKGERTIVDKNVRDTWEMDVTKVTFENPTWKRWIEKTIVPEVCESLGINVATTMPRAELYKLLVYEKGSHFLPHQDTEKTPGMFATIVIILPSSFTGGSLKLSHARDSTIVDASAHSSFATHVTAWYTDVYHSVSKVQSGYRLALSYNLIHTNAPSLKPTLAYMSAEAQELRHVLLSWKQRQYPEKIIYLLDHMYSEYNLQASSLKGKDAARVTHLGAVAESLRFRICLVTVELHQSGQANDCGYHDDYDPYSEDPYEEEPSSLSIGDVEESEFKITSAYDLDGNEIELNEDLDIDDDDCIPYPLSKTTPDEKEYEGYQGNAGGNMDLWYRCTALLIWPAGCDSEIVVWNYVEYAREHLEGVTSRRPTKNDREVVNELMDWMEENAGDDEVDEVAEIITRAAVQWKDAEMWVDTLRAAQLDCRLAENLDAWIIAEDVSILGFDKVEDFLADFMENCEDDDVRADMLSALEELGEQKDIKEIKAWIPEHRERAPPPKSTKEIDQGIVQELIISAQRHGGTYLRDTVIPQVEKDNPRWNFLLLFATTLRNSPDLTSTAPNILNASIAALLTLAINQDKLFPFVKSSPDKQENQRRPDLKRWMSIFELSKTTDARLIGLFCQRMQSSIESYPVERLDTLAEEFLPSAMRRLDSWARSNDPSILPGDVLFLPFWKATLRIYMERAVKYQEPLVLALHWHGNLSTTMNEFTQLLIKLCKSTIKAVQALAMHAHGLLQKVTNDVEVTSARAILHTTCETMLNHCQLTAIDSALAMHTLLKCAEHDLAQPLLNRLMQHASDNVNSQDLARTCLIPLTKSFIYSLRKCGMKWPSEPISGFAAFSIMRAVELAGRMFSSNAPASNIDLGCNCVHCKDLEVFVTDSRTELSITAAQFTRTHVEKQLSTKGTTWGFTTTTIKGRAPYTLKITKPPRIDSIDGQASRDAIFTALNVLGPLSMQKQVMGNKWPEMCQSLGKDPSEADTNPDAFQRVATANPANPASLPNSNTTVQRAGVTSPPAVVHATPSTLGQKSKSNPVVASSSTTANASTSNSRTSKRPHEQAMGNQATSVRTQGAKRSKLSNRPIEIIELSDSD